MRLECPAWRLNLLYELKLTLQVSDFYIHFVFGQPIAKRLGACVSQYLIPYLLSRPREQHNHLDITRIFRNDQRSNVRALAVTDESDLIRVNLRADCKYVTIAATSRARSSKVSDTQSPVEPPTPRLTYSRTAIPRPTRYSLMLRYMFQLPFRVAAPEPGMMMTAGAGVSSSGMSNVPASVTAPVSIVTSSTRKVWLVESGSGVEGDALSESKRGVLTRPHETRNTISNR